jgi:hypothetical protein
VKGYTNESKLVEAIVKAVRKKYPEVWSFNVHGGPMQMAGVPDLLFCIEGLLIGAEAKNPGPSESLEHARNRATSLQRMQIRNIIKAGGMAGVVTSVEETLDLIERALEHQRRRTQ